MIGYKKIPPKTIAIFPRHRGREIEYIMILMSSFGKDKKPEGATKSGGENAPPRIFNTGAPSFSIEKILGPTTPTPNASTDRLPFPGIFTPVLSPSLRIPSSYEVFGAQIQLSLLRYRIYIKNIDLFCFSTAIVIHTRPIFINMIPYLPTRNTSHARAF